LLLTACSRADAPLHRDYRTEVECVPPYDDPVAWDEAIGRFDRDGDLQLTENDLRAGEAAAIARVSGDYLDNPGGAPEREGFANHTDWNATIRATDEDVYELQMRLNCLPTVVATVSFRVGAGWSGEPSTAEILDFIFDAVDAHARNEPGAATIDGPLLVSATDGRMSGAFEGGVDAPLHAWDIPDDLPYPVSLVTGQVGEVPTFAFRDLPVEP
jgi:hypothetical protein